MACVSPVLPVYPIFRGLPVLLVAISESESERSDKNRLELWRNSYRNLSIFTRFLFGVRFAFVAFVSYISGFTGDFRGYFGSGFERPAQNSIAIMETNRIGIRRPVRIFACVSCVSPVFPALRRIGETPGKTRGGRNRRFQVKKESVGKKGRRASLSS